MSNDMSRHLTEAELQSCHKLMIEEIQKTHKEKMAKITGGDMDYTGLNESLQQSHSNLLHTSMDLQKRLLKSEKNFEFVAKCLLASLGLNIILIVCLFGKVLLWHILLKSVI